MIIAGLQKLTLLDYPGHLACTVFLKGCNFRCPFCQNSSLINSSLINSSIINSSLIIGSDEAGAESNSYVGREEFFDFLAKRKGKLQGVCITGGEPTICRELPEFLREIKNAGYSVKLDTNGYEPDMLELVINEGLVDMAAMDIKTDKAGYAAAAGVSKLDISRIERSARLLMDSKIEYEFRTTAVRELHDRGSFENIGKWLAGADRYFIQSFKDSDGVLAGRGRLHSFEAQQLNEFMEILRKTIPNAGLRGVEE